MQQEWAKSRSGYGISSPQMTGEVCNCGQIVGKLWSRVGPCLLRNDLNSWGIRMMPVDGALAAWAVGADRIIDQNARLAVGDLDVRPTERVGVEPAPVQRRAIDVIRHHGRPDAGA